MCGFTNEDIKRKAAIDLTSQMVHKHYCENDVEGIIAMFDDRFSWFGVGEEEYAVGAETVAGIFRQFAGKIPKCNISDEQYDAIEVTPEVYLCTGRMWIATDPSTNMYLRVHQRIAAIFRWVQGKPRCCHVHISNPYLEMTEEDVGFPARMGRQTYEYLQEQIARQKMQMEAQTAMLQRMSFEDSLTGLFNRNWFNQSIANDQTSSRTQLGVAYFDLNGLKGVNDRLGHSAGDALICRTANHIREAFPGKAYRLGGDEFLVIDEELDESAFRTAVASLCERMEQDGISSAAGVSWRGSGCSIKEQFEEADKLMYQEKMRFYSIRERDRRRR